MKNRLALPLQAAISATPLMGILGVLFLTGTLDRAGPVVAAVFTALLTTIAVEPVRATIARSALADQQRVQFCAQALIALQAIGDFVSEAVLTYHPNWHPKLSPGQKERGERLLETLVPVIGLAKMWAPREAARPLEVLAEEIRDAMEFTMPTVDDPTDAYVPLQKALTAARHAITGLRKSLPA
jgi:hypothetical protein